MLLIQRKGQYILSYNPATDRYAISRYDGKIIDGLALLPMNDNFIFGIL